MALNQESITNPQLGHIYPGDYFDGIPFDEYIGKDQPLPEGKKIMIFALSALSPVIC